ncbi:MFS transporter, FHS family, L-fucose permease [Cnuella takakiae]|uniref:MFS transporter, FHS family, L-fucose permease n=1 Tax=Cnuella takakiae TaxID=1302690 RepID=A0A1M4T1I0_9BACT|nr:L-fucose:H+ symporter permease [Cnuella takakiae]OLY90658.1 L-fucose:H+ symporter permease [Cnuella takakiae]SHE38342.1 MFS transporter, FHS family, L-fucose permease [Cnuella takakiae]
MQQRNKYLFPFILVTSLFFLWAFLHNINPILIPHLKKACQLTDTESALIDSSVYLGYFLVALPAGWFMHRFGYKKGVMAGLLLYGIGAALFLPAADSRSFTLFLVALFIIASGATFLETVANPYITKLGNPDTATQRLNFAQSFNGVGAFIAPIIGGRFILSGIEHSPEELSRMDAAGTLNSYLQTEASAIRLPYLVIAVLVLLLAALFFFTRLPEGEGKEEKGAGGFSFRVLRHAQVRWGVVAQFFYVGAQVCVGSFFIRFAKHVMNMPEKDAAFYWGSIAMVGFMLGRFTGTFFMKYLKPERLLALYAVICMALLAVASFVPGAVAVYAVMAVPFFMSIMFPTIFALGIQGLGEEGKIASSLIVMSIVGGAFFPLIMGWISDATGGNIQVAYIIPLLCFVVILFFALRQKAVAPQGSEKLVLTH